MVQDLEKKLIYEVIKAQNCTERNKGKEEMI